MREYDDDVYFPAIDLAAKRLDLDDHDLAESMLCRLNNGESYWSALHGVVAEAMQRRGRYDGETKRRIDSGDIFSARPAPIPETPLQMMKAVESGRADVFDVLALAGAMDAAAHHAEEEIERRKAAKLDSVAANGRD